MLAPCAVIALSVWSILRVMDREHPNVSAPSPSVSAPVGAGSAASNATGLQTAAPATSSSTAAFEDAEDSATEFYGETGEGEPSTPRKASRKRYATVQQAAAESCSTASVEGLSRQIIEQARCLEPNAFVPLPSRANLVVASNVFAYLERDARAHLLQALAANPSKTMKINSALRTVAQQYLVSRWGAAKRCGVQLATRPGESNHEIGVALDVAEPAQWRPALEAHDFRWLGASDRVHFDYKGSDTPPSTATDVQAFQILWNKNHPDDEISADGRYTPATEQRLKKSPASGFAIGPSCSKASPPKRHR
jgi:hypothetical protein